MRKGSNRIKSVLHNFLGTYTSRYTDYDGYWLFGLIAGGAIDLKIDLLSPCIEKPQSPEIQFAISNASKKFEEQMQKADFIASQLIGATLKITDLPGAVRDQVNQTFCEGHNVQLTATAILKNGTKYEREIRIFVAPHNPSVEQRSINRL